MNKNLYKNYAYNSIYQLLLLIIPLLLTPFVTRILGSECIGQYSYTRSVVTYFILFGSVGSNMYAQREVAFVSNDRQNRSKVFWEILLIRCVLLFISLAFYGVIGIHNGRYSKLFLIQSLDIIATMVDITWYFQGMEEFGKITFRNMLMKVVSVVAILSLVRNPDDLWLYVAIYSLGNLAGQLWMWKDLRGDVCRVDIHCLHPERHLKEIALLFIPQVAIQIYLVIDKTMIELLTNDSSQTGYYELAQTIQRAGVTLVTAFGTAAASRVSYLKSQSDSEGVYRLITQSYELVCLIAVPVAMGIGAIANNLIPWFMGPDYLPVAQLIIILCPLILVIGLSNISGIQYMVPMGKQNQMTVSSLVGVIINVFLNALWIPKYGAIGAAFASVAAEVSVMLIQHYFIKGIINSSIIIGNFFQAFLSGCIMVVVIKITEHVLLKSPSILHTFLLIAEGFVVYMGMQMLFKNRILRDMCNKLINRIS